METELGQKTRQYYTDREAFKREIQTLNAARIHQQQFESYVKAQMQEVRSRLSLPEQKILGIEAGTSEEPDELERSFVHIEESSE